ncbi:hypothetical protein EV702DRAFT_1083307 [Suillus placidus]|uniref:Uncharacterized protein n=1 Tax=Suillus placidus TaxID=48579 RepID=A0A9P7A1C5_9AGAM|nr:hypothetical protein EV702DRAFT_1083307 [Suillus placidus]
MRFSFLTAIVTLAAIISVSASETPICPEKGGTLSYDTLAKCCDQNTFADINVNIAMIPSREQADLLVETH